jgi:hypothetical protein
LVMILIPFTHDFLKHQVRYITSYQN